MMGWSVWVADAVGHEELPDHEENSQWKAFQKQLTPKLLRRNIVKFGIIAAYIAVSNLYGSFVPERYNFVESTYFAVITVTSQGMGDFQPQTDKEKAFLIFFIYWGVGLVCILVINAAHSFFQWHVKRIWQRIDTRDEIPTEQEIRMNFYRQILMATAVMVCVNGIGVAFMCWNEGFTFINAFYWSTVTICSIGYGSEFEQKQSTILFHIFYIPFAVVVGMMALGQFSAAYLEMRTELRRINMLKKPLTASSLRAMDVDNQNGVSSGEFLMYMLTQEGLCARSDCLHYLRRFNEIDIDGNGQLDSADLQMWAARLEAEKREQQELELQSVQVATGVLGGRIGGVGQNNSSRLGRPRNPTDPKSLTGTSRLRGSPEGDGTGASGAYKAAASSGTPVRSPRPQTMDSPDVTMANVRAAVRRQSDSGLQSTDSPDVTMANVRAAVRRSNREKNTLKGRRTPQGHGYRVPARLGTPSARNAVELGLPAPIQTDRAFELESSNVSLI